MEVVIRLKREIDACGRSPLILHSDIFIGWCEVLAVLKLIVLHKDACHNIWNF